MGGEDVAVAHVRKEGDHFQLHLRLGSERSGRGCRAFPGNVSAEPRESPATESIARTIAGDQRHALTVDDEHEQDRDPRALALGTCHQLRVNGAQHGDRASERRLIRISARREREGKLFLHPDRRVDHVGEAHRAARNKRETPLGIEVRERSLPIGAPHEALDEDLRRDRCFHRFCTIWSRPNGVNSPFYTHGMSLAVLPGMETVRDGQNPSGSRNRKSITWRLQIASWARSLRELHHWGLRNITRFP